MLSCPYNTTNSANLTVVSDSFSSSEKPYTTQFELSPVKMIAPPIPSHHVAAAVSDDEDDDVMTKTRIDSNKRQRRQVCFKDPTKMIATKKKSIKRKRKQISEYDASFWYTRQEIKTSHKAIITASKAYEERKKGFASSSSTETMNNKNNSSLFSKNYEYSKQNRKRKVSSLSLITSLTATNYEKNEEDIQLLQWFSSERLKQRKRMRKQMKETIKAVQDFECTTKTKTPPELLSQLLQRQSKYAVQEAIGIGYKTASSLSTKPYHRQQHYHSDSSLHYNHQRNPAA